MSLFGDGWVMSPSCLLRRCFFESFPSKPGGRLGHEGREGTWAYARGCEVMKSCRGDLRTHGSASLGSAAAFATLALVPLLMVLSYSTLSPQPCTGGAAGVLLPVLINQGKLGT